MNEYRGSYMDGPYSIGDVHVAREYLLAQALCRAQEAGQSLHEVAPTTAAHWRDVAVRALRFLPDRFWDGE